MMVELSIAMQYVDVLKQITPKSNIINKGNKYYIIYPTGRDAIFTIFLQ
jgi:hypothetical protein